ncbi:MAG: TIGR00341 family protein [Candidatus Dechloromonas phosphoritropha]
MKYVEVVADASSTDNIRALADKSKTPDFRLGAVDDEGMRSMRILVSDDKIQSLLDNLQNILGAQHSARIVVLAVETTLPKPKDEKRKLEDAAIAAREELYAEVEKNSQLDLNYLVFIALSTVVAAIGLVENNVAVVIGAMVIAPLLGPNLALSLATAMGDVGLMRRSVIALLTGVALAVLISALIGKFWIFDLSSSEFMSRTNAGLDSVVLALASGAAAALSLTARQSSALVGVMVAVALLPPAAVLGIALGQGNYGLAAGAGLLLAVNVVCVNLASKLVFFIKGVRPRTWLEKEKAQRAMVIYIAGWLVTLTILLLVIYSRRAVSM